MPISSYVLRATSGSGLRVAGQLGAWEGCEAVGSDDGSMVLLVTESSTDKAEEVLRARIEAHPDVLSVSLAFASSEAS